jgi:FkbM family methyltransferase
MRIKSGLRSNPLARSAREFLPRIVLNVDSPFRSILRNLEESNVSSVIDVGANVGQFGLDIRRHGFKGQMFSYEPVEETFGVLAHTIMRHQPWKAIQLGLGASECERTINISGNAGLSSSLLEMGSVHLENFPDSVTVLNQKVTISTLDNQLEALGIDPRRIMLKLDVQGYEAEVLRGAAKSLAKIPLCYLEVSLVPLYKGETTFLPILNLLAEAGHEVIDVFRSLKSNDGKLLQLDILTKLTKN